MKIERLASLLVIGQQFLFTAETAIIHHLGGVLTFGQLGLLRSLGGLCLAACLALTVGWSVVHTKNGHLQLVRGVAALSYMFIQVFSFSILPFSDATAISYTQALYVVILAPWVLGETVGVQRYVAVAVGFIGALLIVKPGLSGVSAIYAVALIGTSLNGLGVVLNRYLCRDDHPVTVMLYVNVICTLGFLYGAFEPWPGAEILPWMLALAVAGPVGMYLGIVALRHADASALAPYMYVRLVLATLGAWLAFGEAIDETSLLGACVIALACVASDRVIAQGILKLAGSLRL